MLQLFYATYWFWVTLKILLCVLLIMSLYNVSTETRIHAEESTANVLLAAEAILLIITFFNDFYKKNILGILKIISGAVLVICSIILVVKLLEIPEDSQGDLFVLGFPVSFLMLFMGIFDILRIKRPPSNDY